MNLETLNWIDIALGGALIISALVGLMRGFLKEILSIALTSKIKSLEKRTPTGLYRVGILQILVIQICKKLSVCSIKKRILIHKEYYFL